MFPNPPTVLFSNESRQKSTRGSFSVCPVARQSPQDESEQSRPAPLRGSGIPSTLGCSPSKHSHREVPGGGGRACTEQEGTWTGSPAPLTNPLLNRSRHTGQVEGSRQRGRWGSECEVWGGGGGTSDALGGVPRVPSISRSPRAERDRTRWAGRCWGSGVAPSALLGRQ